VNAHPIDADLELVRLLEPAHGPQVGAEEPNLKLVLAIERQRALDRESTDRSQRQPLDVARLRRILADAVHVARRRQLRIADGEGGNAIRRREIALEEHRRHAKNVGDVVEPRARIVGRQQCGRIDVERQQVANRVGVFGAIEPMDERAARIGRLRRHTIEPRLQRGYESFADVCSGRRHPGRRHHPRTHFLDDLFPQLGIGLHVQRIGRLELEPARLRS
jgi:hypothetical protein